MFNHITYARNFKNLTQKQLSQETRIGVWFISMIENGTGIPTPDQAERLARALDLHPSQLLLPAPRPQKPTDDAIEEVSA